MRIELIRHGQTALQAERRYQGATDAPLSPEGKRMLRRAERCPDRVYVTPLLRTRQTAEILFPEAEQTVIPDLREMNFGDFEGRNYIEMAHDPDYRAWVDGMCRGRCPGGEDYQEFSARVCDAFAALLDHNAARGEDSLVIVAHGGTQMAVMERFAAEKRDYWSWQLPCGQGYLLETDWPADRRLHVAGRVDYTEG